MDDLCCHSSWCLCGHYVDQHDLDGNCVLCECMEFEPSELMAAQEQGYMGEE